VNLHASCVSISGRGVLLTGRSGAGKSDLALRLIDRGARLVSDDRTEIEARNGRLVARAAPPVGGLIEARGIGLLPIEALSEAVLCLAIDLDAEPERMPEQAGSLAVAGLELPQIALAPLETSAPIKVEHGVARFGLVP